MLTEEHRHALAEDAMRRAEAQAGKPVVQALLSFERHLVGIFESKQLSVHHRRFSGDYLTTSSNQLRQRD